MINVVKIVSLLFLFCSCADYSRPIAGRDKQGAGLFSGALLGAGSGMITGGQFTASAGPGAFIGMGFGAMWGGLQGLGLDILEDEDFRILAEVAKTDAEVAAQYTILEHFELKSELHPGRDIFPADIFFGHGTVELTHNGDAVAQIFGNILGSRSPSSRIEIAMYQVSRDKSSSYATYLGNKRGNAIGLALIRSGIEPRRLVFKTVLLDQPLVIDPYDVPERYYQAVEFALLDM